MIKKGVGVLLLTGILAITLLTKDASATPKVDASWLSYKGSHRIKSGVKEFDQSDAQLLMKVAQAEAGNQGIDGMWMVMSVVYNRVHSSDFPNTIKEVIYQPYQFSTVTNGSIDKVEISTECHLALAKLEMGNVVPKIVAFETLKSNSNDKYFNKVYQYEGHKFYTKKD